MIATRCENCNSTVVIRELDLKDKPEGVYSVRCGCGTAIEVVVLTKLEPVKDPEVS